MSLTASPDDGLGHAELMDRTYRYQRLIYDLTRRYYLLGRDHLIRDLSPGPRDRVLEVACGTGRNLALIGRAYPGRELFGLDISREMLRSAEATLGRSACLAQADACTFDGESLFNRRGFDRIVISFGLSMIPDWEAAVTASLAQLRPGGSLHLVDFGDQARLPRLFRRLLLAWLARFHVTPREDFEARLGAIARAQGCRLDFTPLYRGYSHYAVLHRA